MTCRSHWSAVHICDHACGIFHRDYDCWGRHGFSPGSHLGRLFGTSRLLPGSPGAAELICSRHYASHSHEHDPCHLHWEPAVLQPQLHEQHQCKTHPTPLLLCHMRLRDLVAFEYRTIHLYHPLGPASLDSMQCSCNYEDAGIIDTTALAHLS